MTPVQVKVAGANGRVLTKTDPGGAVFAPIPGKAARPVYSYGPTDAKTRPVLFTCPVSAVPDQVFDLLGLWHECRLMKTLPVAGGWLDQPLGVRKAFPIFEAEALGNDRRLAGNPHEAAALAAGMALKAAFGGK